MEGEDYKADWSVPSAMKMYSKVVRIGAPPPKMSKRQDAQIILILKSS